MKNNYFKKLLKPKSKKEQVKSNQEAALWNKDLIKRLEVLESNRIKSIKLLTDFHIQNELETTGLLITRTQALNMAKITYAKLKSANLVDGDNLLVPSVEEYYREYTNA